MNRLYILVVMALLVAMATGCGGAHRYDSRLTAVDSLMQPDPDSALALVQAITPASLTTEGDRAYRDLLLTQARYRCYITATSDSDINRALDYYRHHDHDREKLTRAYIYKGAVMEELGHPDSAMFYYKHAEATADEKDYSNLGTINLRIAALYRIYYGDEEICFEKYRSALKYSELTGNIHYQQICYYCMAMCRAMATDSVWIEYLEQSRTLAIQLNDSLAIFKCEELLCRYLSLGDSTLNEAKQFGQNCLQNHSKYVNRDLLLDLALIYAKQHLNDSAKSFFRSLNVIDTTNLDGRDRMRRYLILSIMARNEGDTAKSNYYNGLKSRITDSIYNDNQINYIQRIENSSNVEKEKNRIKKITGLRHLLWILVATGICLLVLIVVFHFYRERRFKELLHGLQHAQLDRHTTLLEQIDDKDSVIERFVQSMVSFMQTAIDASEKDSPKVMRKRIKEALPNVANDDFWAALHAHLDNKYDNLISNFAQNPKITDIDLRFIGLSCCGFSYLETAIALGITPTYVSKKRRMIAKKLGLNIPLQDYLNSITKK